MCTCVLYIVIAVSRVASFVLIYTMCYLHSQCRRKAEWGPLKGRNFSSIFLTTFFSSLPSIWRPFLMVTLQKVHLYQPLYLALSGVTFLYQCKGLSLPVGSFHPVMGTYYPVNPLRSRVRWWSAPTLYTANCCWWTEYVWYCLRHPNTWRITRVSIVAINILIAEILLLLHADELVSDCSEKYCWGSETHSGCVKILSKKVQFSFAAATCPFFAQICTKYQMPYLLFTLYHLM